MTTALGKISRRMEAARRLVTHADAFLEAVRAESGVFYTAPEFGELHLAAIDAKEFATTLLYASRQEFQAFALDQIQDCGDEE